jgi:Flp pilus assembly protein CpaB
VLAALLAAVVVGTVVSALQPASTPTLQVVVAARDLAPGAVLAAGDLALRAVARDAAPPDALLDPAGAVARTVAAPVRAGEAVRARDVVSPGLVSGLGPGMRALPVRLADDAAAGLVRAGDSVDVLASYGGDGTASASAVVVASDVHVLVAPAPTGSGSGSLLGGSSAATSGGAVLVLAATQAQALDLARAVAAGRLSVALRPG